MEFTALSGLGAALEDVGTLSLLDLPPLDAFEAPRGERQAALRVPVSAEPLTKLSLLPN